MDIDVVIIGLNSEATLKQCIESVLNVHYPLNKLHIFYVDGGSSDKSLSIANSYPTVKVIEMDQTYPTSGAERNRGWKVGNSPIVQFLDSDARLDPYWLSQAIEVLNNGDAVRGNRKELYPDRSFYNWIADQEWNEIAGDSKAFGGEVLISRKTLAKLGGYRDDLIAGEDPELSWRLQLQGGQILQLDIPMSYHDLGMFTLKQYLKRSFRTGYGFAQVHELHPEFWNKEYYRILIRAGGFLILALCGLFFQILWFIPALLLLFFPLVFRVPKLKSKKGLSYLQTVKYAWHCSWVVLPQFFGIIRYHLGVLLNSPLRNDPSHLHTRSSKR